MPPRLLILKGQDQKYRTTADIGFSFVFLAIGIVSAGIARVCLTT